MAGHPSEDGMGDEFGVKGGVALPSSANGSCGSSANGAVAAWSPVGIDELRVLLFHRTAVVVAAGESSASASVVSTQTREPLLDRTIGDQLRVRRPVPTVQP
jgi:hypothetical protein